MADPSANDEPRTRPEHPISLAQSFRFAAAGIVYALRTQRNARIQLALGAAALVMAAVLRIPLEHWAVLVLTIGLVMAAEMANTFVEALVDLVSPDYHDSAKIAKDVAAGSVLVVSITAAVVGLIVLGPPLWHFVFG